MPTRSKDTDVERFEMIAPLLNDALDPFERRREFARIMETYDVSKSTIYFYIRKYHAGGLKGLEPKTRSEKGKSKVISDALLEIAAELRKELPSRSIRVILKIMEGEKLIKPGQIARTTLNRLLVARGLGSHQLQKDEEAVQGSKRFQRKNRNDLWQLDSKHGPRLKDPITGATRKTYLIAAIDDATRNIMYSKFYDSDSTESLEDCFRHAVIACGKPRSVFVDNGTNYISKRFRRACSSIGTKHYHALPKHPASKGKIEKFNGFIEEFLDELRLQPVNNIDELNRVYHIWLEEGYLRKPHSALTFVDANGKKVEQTPLQAYERNSGKVTFVSVEELKRAFMWEETRGVDNAGCFSFKGHSYEAGIDLIGKTIDIRYDPLDPRIVEVWHAGKFHRKSEELKDLPEFLPRNRMPPKIIKDAPGHSRLFSVYGKANITRPKRKHVNIPEVPAAKEEIESKQDNGVAISFAKMEEESDE
jgi:transposase InsO family protein